MLESIALRSEVWLLSDVPRECSAEYGSLINLVLWSVAWERRLMRRWVWKPMRWWKPMRRWMMRWWRMVWKKRMRRVWLWMHCLALIL